MTESKCRGCGRAIEWAKTTSGKNVPLERVRIVQVVDGIATAKEETTLVNHFKTCPKADQFSAGKGGK